METLLQRFTQNPIGIFIYNNLFTTKMRKWCSNKHKELIEKRGGTHREGSLQEILNNDEIPTEVKEEILDQRPHV